MRAFFRRVGSDIRARRNIDNYVVSFVALVLALLTLAGDVIETLLGPDLTMQVTTAVILSALAILVLNLTVPEGRAGDLDAYLNDRSDFKVPFHEFIQDASKVWIYAPSAANILSTATAEAIRKRVLEREKGECRVIIQNPAAEEAVQLLKLQLDDRLEYKVQNLEDEIPRALGKLRNIKQSSASARGDFGYRLLDYGPGFSLIAIDPHRNNGQVIVEFYGYAHYSTESRMHIVITRAESERWFTYWTSQFEYMWEDARPDEGDGASTG